MSYPIGAWNQGLLNLRSISRWFTFDLYPNVEAVSAASRFRTAQPLCACVAGKTRCEAAAAFAGPAGTAA